MALLTARSSTIFIATGDKTRVYHSMEEIPLQFRRKLQQTTQGMNSATILIANKLGREELMRALQVQPPVVRQRLAATIRPSTSERQSEPDKLSRIRSIRTWLELLLPVAIGASLWFLIESRF